MKMLEDATGQLNANRNTHAAIAQALMVIREAIGLTSPPPKG